MRLLLVRLVRLVSLPQKWPSKPQHRRSMRAISLWQPWASAMAVGSKRIETRHWSTNVRGTVAIHAAQRKVLSELSFLGCMAEWKGALAQYRHWRSDDFTFLRSLPFGAIVAVGELVDVRRTIDLVLDDELHVNRFAHKAIIPAPDVRASLRWCERQMGDYSAERFGWIFKNVRPLTTPIPFKGKQGFFNVPDELFDQL